jgi:NAD(P)-dependent dehydrogenase (short-subunit alcohol dehydrogenase family)
MPAPQLRFDGKVAIVTGAGGGLGRAHALALARRGARVVVNDLAVPVGTQEPPAAATVVEEIRALGGEAVADEHDVVAGGAAVVGTALEAYGRVDLVCNNAGVGGGGTIADGDPAQWDRTIAITLHGSIAVTRAAWPHLLAAGGGHVLMTASNASFGGHGTGAYSAAKASMIGLTRSLALEGRSAGIRVNAIMPAAWTRLTQLLPAGPLTEMLVEHFPPEEVAAFVVWLCHPDAGVSGEIFSVGGGRAARVVLAEAPGAVAGDATPEAWAAVADVVMDMHGAAWPLHMMAEVRWSAEQLGLSLG